MSHIWYWSGLSCFNSPRLVGLSQHIRCQLNIWLLVALNGLSLDVWVLDLPAQMDICFKSIKKIPWRRAWIWLWESQFLSSSPKDCVFLVVKLIYRAQPTTQLGDFIPFQITIIAANYCFNTYKYLSPFSGT